MVVRNIVLGPNENRLLLNLAASGKAVFTINEAQKILGSTISSVKHVLMGLTEKGRLQRIERGKYLLIPEEAGIERFWAEEPWIIVPHLVNEYYVGFWTAMNYWGMTEQIPYTVFVVTTRQKKKTILKFGNQKFQFITFSRKKFFGFVEEKSTKTKFNISSKEKTIVDGLMHPEYCGGITEVTKAMWNVRKEINWNTVLDMAKQVGINVVLRRLGYLLQILELESNISESIKQNLNQYPYQYLDPSTIKTKIGYSNDYGLIVNITRDELLGWREY
ncbi:MAG: type IV toxin-antitoxin system AbiEi family antitoxin [Candidatus Nitrosotenuis sp.]